MKRKVELSSLVSLTNALRGIIAAMTHSKEQGAGLLPQSDPTG